MPWHRRPACGLCLLPNVTGSSTHNTASRMAHRALWLAACSLCAGTLAGFAACDRKPPTSSAITPPPPRTPDHTYTVRGEVIELPDGRPQSAFRVKHEAIDNFADGTGKIVGMGAMVMEFPLPPQPHGPEINSANLKRSDKVEITFAVWWKGEPPIRYPDYLVTALKRLPADTALEFRPAKPPKP